MLVHVINASTSQWCGCISILSYTHLNLALLLHKQGLVATGVATTVQCLQREQRRGLTDTITFTYIHISSVQIPVKRFLDREKRFYAILPFRFFYFLQTFAKNSRFMCLHNCPTPLLKSIKLHRIQDLRWEKQK